MFTGFISHFCTTWKSGWRSRAFIAVSIIGLGLIACAWLAAAFSARQPQAVALDVGLSAIRISLTLLSLSWIQELVGREIEKRTVFFVLAYPQSRKVYVLGRYFGIMSMLGVALIFLAIVLVLVVKAANWGYIVPHQLQLGWPLIWTLLGILLDLSVVTAVAMSIALISTSAIMPLLCGIGFALSARMMGPILTYLSQGADGDTELANNFTPIINKIAWLIPDLDRLDIRSWPLYGIKPDFSIFLASNLSITSYTIVILAIGVFAFNKREFS
ncbi:ABC transporter permease [Deefgea rivuli]|uniref:ABC transporter permease n=1 Tax=Deefgea rivuli TaxID=400948 RepID=UPI0004830CF4|nr:ABC transporter permease [Deefgea rivuli]